MVYLLGPQNAILTLGMIVDSLSEQINEPLNIVTGVLPNLQDLQSSIQIASFELLSKVAMTFPICFSQSGGPLDVIGGRIHAILDQRLKDTATKQDLDNYAVLKGAAVDCLSTINRNCDTEGNSF